MIKHGVQSKDKGAPTCQNGEVTALGGARNTWSSVRFSGYSAWGVDMGNGNMNNNNTYNRYVGVGVSELSEDEIMRFLHDEEECFKNKHDSIEATRYHYNLSLVYRIALAVKRGYWKQGKAIVFAIQYPTLREVWAADYGDRILHHDVAPVINEATERLHNRNGDVSHGNRLKHSAHTASLQIMRNMQMRPNGYVGKRDLSGFFMSINRKMACERILQEIGENPKNELIKKLILHNPVDNCTIQSPIELMMKIPSNKSLFHAEEGYGLPIGNFYSQLVANAYLSSVDAIACSDKWRSKIGYTRFVDDICVIGDDVSTINTFFQEVAKEVSRLGLKLNSHKMYMQPVRQGVNFCGRTIHAHGIYIGNRIVRACKNVIRSLPQTLQGAKKLVGSLNSYFGFLKHCKAFRIQQNIALEVMNKFGCYITQRLRRGQILFKISYAYSNKTISNNNISNYINNIKFINYEIRKRTKRGIFDSNCGNREGCRQVFA